MTGKYVLEVPDWLLAKAVEEQTRRAEKGVFEGIDVILERWLVRGSQEEAIA